MAVRNLQHDGIVPEHDVDEVLQEHLNTAVHCLDTRNMAWCRSTALDAQVMSDFDAFGSLKLMSIHIVSWRVMIVWSRTL
jgi:hypothetical protein